jgi:hypothetical protein
LVGVQTMSLAQVFVCLSDSNTSVSWVRGAGRTATAPSPLSPHSVLPSSTLCVRHVSPVFRPVLPVSGYRKKGVEFSDLPPPAAQDDPQGLHRRFRAMWGQVRHLLSLAGTRCHSLSLAVTRCHSLSLAVTRCYGLGMCASGWAAWDAASLGFERVGGVLVEMVVVVCAFVRVCPSSSYRCRCRCCRCCCCCNWWHPTLGSACLASATAEGRLWELGAQDPPPRAALPAVAPLLPLRLPAVRVHPGPAGTAHRPGAATELPRFHGHAGRSGSAQVARVRVVPEA